MHNFENTNPMPRLAAGISFTRFPSIKISPAFGFSKSCDHSKQCCLSTSTWSKQCCKFPFFNPKTYIVRRPEVSVLFIDISHFDIHFIFRPFPVVCPVSGTMQYFLRSVQRPRSILKQKVLIRGTFLGGCVATARRHSLLSLPRQLVNCSLFS